MTTHWKSVLIGPDKPVVEVIRVLEASHLQIALVVDEDGRLRGSVTDGDVRRGILRSLPLESPVSEIMHANPVTMSRDTDRADILSAMRLGSYRHMPLLDDDGRVVGLETLEELLTPRQRENCVVLMAGGFGKRLQPLTNDTPKPMLDVGGQPILETTIKRFMDKGFNRFIISVHYLHDQIMSYFGDGRKLGAEIIYLHEAQPLGTAGCLSKLTDRPSAPFFVMNGDILTDLDAQRILDFHVEHDAAATVCVRQYETPIPFGVVEVDNHRLVRIEEKPIKRHFVNAGIYVLEPAVLDLLKPDEPIDMPDLLTSAKQAVGDILVFPIQEYWVDIGQHDDFEKANVDHSGKFS